MSFRAKPTGINKSKISTIERFSRNFIVDSSGCWVWKGYIAVSGYGQFSIKSKTKLAHRVMWEAVGKKVDYAKQLDHTCENRPCVNPAHLEQVEHRVNNFRGNSTASHNRQKTHCAAGHEFTPENIYKNKHQRVCRTCHKGWVKHYQRKVKELKEIV